VTITGNFGNVTATWRFRNIKAGLFAFKSGPYTKNNEVSLKDFSSIENALRIARGLDIVSAVISGPPSVQNDEDKRALKRDLAFSDVDTVLLLDKKCADFFTSGRSIDEVRDTLRAVLGNVKINSAEGSSAIASTAGSGSGAAAVITLYSPFFADDGNTRAGVAAGYHFNPSTGRAEELFTGLYPRQYRALTVLHEFAHALGIIPPDRATVDGSGRTSQANDALMFDKCGKGLSKLKDR
jgi:hypothetical protein